jgi:uncharacterized protein (DUF1684 family)
VRLYALPFIALTLAVAACRKDPGFPALSPADSMAIVEENLAYRTSRDEYLREDPSSPFNRDTTAMFSPTRWYPVNPGFRGRSVLHRFDNPLTIDVAGTGGEVRRQLRYGYFEFPVPDSAGRPLAVRLNVYRQAGPQADPRFANFLSLWFTDETTGTETYGVGRYVDVEREHPDPNHVYTIDLNKAYNPFCAYSGLYSCAIPTEEDHVPVPIRAGEMMFHE